MTDIPLVIADQENIYRTKIKIHKNVMRLK